jgi:hypothetical protein
MAARIPSGISIHVGRRASVGRTSHKPMQMPRLDVCRKKFHSAISTSKKIIDIVIMWTPLILLGKK